MRKKLIQFFSENKNDDDEVLLAMAEELGAFIPYVGGVKHVHVLLPPLETLCTVEETCVRDWVAEFKFIREVHINFSRLCRSGIAIESL
ncbi:Serine/threonine-protein phosphatase 2A 65 kDa regulatory subunit A beta isoform [Camellia lanceoleosa]|uniref:Serine/threonine-protein phosphatase 2A 65 kDa regulatory subunit A beta isoform n=1 Tax=Camellia lanceoleosa TaxID=1840588 RepID=A0ACC0ISG7_9ERIC|nr:Serine/threonine-protein phosphatase 2A 65 kDa regulatory subunit A beta isoform [Camellia lanceoleosa]